MVRTGGENANTFKVCACACVVQCVCTRGMVEHLYFTSRDISVQCSCAGKPTGWYDDQHTEQRSRLFSCQKAQVSSHRRLAQFSCKQCMSASRTRARTTDACTHHAPQTPCKIKWPSVLHLVSPCTKRSLIVRPLKSPSSGCVGTALNTPRTSVYQQLAQFEAWTACVCV